MIKAYLIWSCLAFGCSSYNNFCETKFYKEVVADPPKYLETMRLYKSSKFSSGIVLTFRHYDENIIEIQDKKYLCIDKTNVEYNTFFKNFIIYKSSLYYDIE